MSKRKLLRVILLSRKQAVKVGELFPQQESGVCAVCNSEITASRKRRYCSDHCKEVAYATQKFFLWKKVRNYVLEQSDWTCNWCGLTREERKDQRWKEIEEKHGEEFMESYGKPNVDDYFEVDHIKPVSKGGKVFDLDNLQVLCQKCNRKKSDKHTGEKDIYDFYDKKDSDCVEKTLAVVREKNAEGDGYV